MFKFIRKYRLTVEPTNKNDLAAAEIHLLPGNDDQIVVTPPMTIEFAISRNPFQRTNTSVIRILNLAESTRVALYKDIFSYYLRRKVTLEAGYEEPLPVIFSGNIQSCASFRPEGGVDFITEMRCWDDGYALANALSNWTLDAPDRNAVVDRLMEDLGTFGIARGIRSDFPGSYTRGRSVCGPTWDALQTETGGFAFIDGGKVNALKDDDCIEGSLDEISSDTGLLATPKRYERGVTCEVLFEPRLEVGQIVNLRTRATEFQAFERSTPAKVMGISHAGTISDAVAGKCKTTVNLFLGPRALNVLAATP